MATADTQRVYTVHDIPPGQSNKQAEVLRELCNKTNPATCSFTPTKEERLRTTSTHITTAHSHRIRSLPKKLSVVA